MESTLAQDAAGCLQMEPGEERDWGIPWLRLSPAYLCLDQGQSVGCSMGISVEGSSSRVLCDAGFGGMRNSSMAISFPLSDRF